MKQNTNLVQKLGLMWSSITKVTTRSISSTNQLLNKEIMDLGLLDRKITETNVTKAYNSLLLNSNNENIKNLKKIDPADNKELILLLDRANDNFNRMNIAEQNYLLTKINLEDFLDMSNKEKNITNLKLICTLSIDLTKSPYVETANKDNIQKIIDNITHVSIVDKKINSSNQHPLLTLHDALFIKSPIEEVTQLSSDFATSNKNGYVDKEKLINLQAARERQENHQRVTELKNLIGSTLINGSSIITTLSTLPLIGVAALNIQNSPALSVSALSIAAAFHIGKNYLSGVNSGITGWLKKGSYGKNEANNIINDESFRDFNYFADSKIAPEIILSIASRPKGFWSEDTINNNINYFNEVTDNSKLRTLEDKKFDCDLFRIKNPSIKSIQIKGKCSGKDLDCLYYLDIMCSIYGYNPEKPSYSQRNLTLIEELKKEGALKDKDVEVIEEYLKIFPDSKMQNLTNKLNGVDSCDEALHKTLINYKRELASGQETTFLTQLNTTLKNHLDVVALKDRNIIIPILGWKQFGGGFKDISEVLGAETIKENPLIKSGSLVKELKETKLHNNSPMETVKNKILSIRQNCLNQSENNNKNKII